MRLPPSDELFAFVAEAGVRAGLFPRLDAPWVPTSDAVVEGMLKLAGVTSTDTVYDLGCGDGRMVIAAAKNCGARAVGVDIDPARIKDCRENARTAGVEELVRFEEADLFEADIHDATVVLLYLLPEVVEGLRPRLLSDLKPGTRVVLHNFGMENAKPDREAEVDGHHIYLWIMPEKTSSFEKS